MARGAVLVTGGAKRLGAAIARRLAADGWRVIVHYGRSCDEAAALAADIGAAGTVGGDLADAGAISDLIARAREVAGRPVAGLVNSASEFSFDRPEAIDPALAVRLHAINCVAPARLAATLAAQEDLEEGSVVNLLDQKLANPNPDFFSYTLSKAALAEATTLMAQAFAPRVRVNAVSPGITLPSGDQDQVSFEATASRNLLRRPVGSAAVADAVAWLMDARSVTGQDVFVDCGQRFVASPRDVMFDA